MPALSESDQLCEAARQQLKQRNAAGALELYLKAVDKEERSILAREGVATAAFLLQQYEVAIEHFKRVTVLDPRRAQPLVNLGAVYNKVKDYPNAIKYLRQAVTRDRKCAEAYYNLGIAHKGLNQLPMAINAYKEAIRINPEMVEAYQNLGNIYLDMKNNSQASVQFRRALDLRPDFERAKRGLERADEAKATAKSSVNPFGRLVNLDEAAKNSQISAYKSLSPGERFQDRTRLHELSRELEDSVTKLLQHAKTDLEHALSGLSQAFQSEDRHAIIRQYDDFGQAKIKYEELSANLLQLTGQLREHESAHKG